MKSPIFSLSLIVLLLCVSLFVVKAHTLGFSESYIDTDAEVVVGIDWYLSNLNPVASYSPYDWFILKLLFDSLMLPNPLNYFDPTADIPWLLAEEPVFHKVNDSYGYWDLRLRDDIYFFDGERLTADDVVFTYKFIKWIGIYNDPWFDVYYIVDHAEKIDEFTVRVFVNTGGYLAARYALDIVVFPKHIYGLEETWGVVDDDPYDVFPDWNVTPKVIINYKAHSPEDPILIGYGPYRLAEWYPKNASVKDANIFILERNPNFFRRAISHDGRIIHPWVPINMTNELYGPYIKRVKIYVVEIDDQATLTSLLAEKTLDLLDVGYADPNLLQSNGYKVFFSERLGFGHLFFNVKHVVPFANNVSLLAQPEFRRAIAYAINKTRICEKVWGGLAKPIDTLVPAMYGDWSIEYLRLTPDTYYESSIDKAIRELSKLGLEDYDGDGWLEWNRSDPESEISICIDAADTSIARKVLSIIADDIKSIGIHCETVFLDPPIIVPFWDFEMLFFGYSTSRIPVHIESLASWGLFSFFGGWENKSYDEMVRRAIYCETNINIAKKYVRDAMLIFWYEQPMIPLYQNILVGAVKIFNDFGYQWYGIISIPGSPVANYYTLLRIIKAKGDPLALIDTNVRGHTVGVGLGVLVFLVLLGIAVFIRKIKEAQSRFLKGF